METLTKLINLDEDHKKTIKELININHELSIFKKDNSIIKELVFFNLINIYQFNHNYCYIVNSNCLKLLGV